ncbi:MAG: leucine-rich repeat domain-containing protein [Verrucomicrobia bacterium]|nr:leucine-rich repeat domain-containing protein [Verrucomicrobiota bacterium]
MATFTYGHQGSSSSSRPINPFSLLYDLYAHSTPDSQTESREQINALPLDIRQKLFWNVWNLNNRPFESNYGEVHVLDNRNVLLQAITNIAREAYGRLPRPDQQRLSYAYENRFAGQLLLELSALQDRHPIADNQTIYEKLLNLIFILEGEDLLEIEQIVHSLPVDLQQRIFWNIWDLAGRPPENNYGEIHLLDSKSNLQLAVSRITHHFLDQLKEKEEILDELYVLGCVDSYDRTSAIQILTVLNEHLENLTPEMRNIIDEWSEWGNDPHAKEALIQFINNPTQTILDLSGTQIHLLPEIFHLEPFVSRLKEFSASHCDLLFLPDSMHVLQPLTRMDISYNPSFNAFQESIGQLTNLKILKADHCNLISLPKSIGDLRALTYLYLANNPYLEPSSLDLLAHLDPSVKIDIEVGCSPSSAQQQASSSVPSSSINVDPEVLSRLNSIKAIAESHPDSLHALTHHFSPNSKILTFDLDQLAKQYITSDAQYSSVELSNFIDWSDIPAADGSRTQFQDAIQEYIEEQSYDPQSIVANRYFGLLAAYFTSQRKRVSIGSNEETRLKEQFRRVYHAIIDADEDCVDQMLSQLEPLVLDIVAEGDLAQSACADQMKIIHFTGLALCKYRNNLLKQIVAKEFPYEPHVADLERYISKQIATEIGQNGEIFETGALFTGVVSDLEGKTALAKARFKEQYKPLEYLLRDLRTYHAINQVSRNQILLWARNNFDLDNLSPLLSEDPKGYEAAEGGNFTYPGLVLLLDQIGIVHPRNS